jgi:hypothetical protein
MNKTLMRLVGLSCLGLIFAGCGVVTQGSQPVADEIGTFQVAPTTAASVTPVKGPRIEETEANTEAARTALPPATLPDIPQPVNELADDEYRWSQLLARDAIAPIYDPQFAPVGQAPYDDNELVIGVEINGEAKAYAIGPLNNREMVNDTVGGVPVLVTW